MKINNHMQAIKVALEIERLESATKNLKKELKSYVEANGAVETNDQIWFIEESESWKFDNLLVLIRRINQKGLNPYNYLNITPANLRKLEFTESELEQLGGRKSDRSNFKKIKVSSGSTKKPEQQTA